MKMGAQFADLLFRRGEARIIAFDPLFCNGEDLRYSAGQETRVNSSPATAGRARPPNQLDHGLAKCRPRA